MMLYVQDELSYDRHHEKADRIFRVAVNGNLNGRELNFATLGPQAARDLRNDYPEVLEAVRLRNMEGVFVTLGERSFKEERFLYADAGFFKVFTVPLLKGRS